MGKIDPARQAKFDKLVALQNSTLEDKVRTAEERIIEWYEHWDGKVAVSFSGGKDSTVLLHIARQLYPDMAAVFVDTGLEYPEVRAFVRECENIVWLKPDMKFKDVLEKYGWPVITKETAGYLREIDSARRNGRPLWERQRLHGIRRDGGKTRYCVPKKWRHMADAPFKVSDRCCEVMKKRPMKRFHKELGLYPILGTMAADSSLRLNSWIRNGCNAFELTEPISRPMSFWMDDDVWDYICLHDIPYAEVYDEGVEHTGCVFCGFGVHLEKRPNRFEQLKKTHPKLWQYVMHRLGMSEVLRYIGVPHGEDDGEEVRPENLAAAQVAASRIG